MIYEHLKYIFTYYFNDFQIKEHMLFSLRIYLLYLYPYNLSTFPIIQQSPSIFKRKSEIEIIDF